MLTETSSQWLVRRLQRCAKQSSTGTSAPMSAILIRQAIMGQQLRLHCGPVVSFSILSTRLLTPPYAPQGFGGDVAPRIAHSLIRPDTPQENEARPTTGSGLAAPRIVPRSLPPVTPQSAPPPPTSVANSAVPHIVPQVAHPATPRVAHLDFPRRAPRTPPLAAPLMTPSPAAPWADMSVPRIAPHDNLPLIHGACPSTPPVSRVAPQHVSRIAPRRRLPATADMTRPPAAPWPNLPAPRVTPHDERSLIQSILRCGKVAEAQSWPSVALSSQNLSIEVIDNGYTGTRWGTVGKKLRALNGTGEVARPTTLFLAGSLDAVFLPSAEVTDVQLFVMHSIISCGTRRPASCKRTTPLRKVLRNLSKIRQTQVL